MGKKREQRKHKIILKSIRGAYHYWLAMILGSYGILVSIKDMFRSYSVEVILAGSIVFTIFIIIPACFIYLTMKGNEEREALENAKNKIH